MAERSRHSAKGYGSLAPGLLLALAAGCLPEAETRVEPEPLPVRTVALVPAPFAASLELVGIVRAAATMPVQSPGGGGTIAYPRRFAAGLPSGETVAAGETIATFRNDDVSHALARARIAAEIARLDLARAKAGFDTQLYPAADFARQQVLTRQALEDLAAAEHDASRLVVRAPAAGKLVVQRVFTPGSDVPAGTVLAEVVTAGPPRVEAWAAAADRERLHPGLEVRFATRRGSEPVATGRVSEVAAVVDAAGTVAVKALVDDRQTMPAPGEGVECEVRLDPRPAALTVPEEALVLGSGGVSVYVVDPGSGARGRTRVRLVPVATGGRGGGRIEVARGLEAGERVVVSGVAFLEDGAVVRETRADAEPPPPPPRSDGR